NATAGGIDIDGVNSTINITNTTNGAGDDINITTVNANNSSIILTSAGTEADAIKLDAAAGGIVINAGDALALDGAGGINIGVVADFAIDVDASTFALDASAVGNNAIALTAVNGGILGKVANTKTLVLGNSASDTYFKLTANTTANAQKIEIKNNTGGDQADAIKLIAVDGGITIDAGGGDDPTDDFIVVGNNFSVTDAGVVTASEFSSTGPTETGEITSELDLPNALVIGTTVGGIDITARGDAAGDDLDITTTGAATEMRLTSASTEADALVIRTTVGGIDITAEGNAAGDDLDITTEGAATEMRLTSESTEADAIKIHAL
ncbi:uncharacterized protein METZ01_LOCUS347223, partial [marine metagenome]